jgi:antitoxin component YwqK of YwqJK toxin-antitoxin module
MKKLTPTLILSLLFLIVGCSTDIESLQLRRGDTYYKINSETPFSGSVIRKWSSGEKYEAGSLRNGKKEGIWNTWYGNKQKEFKLTYKNGVENGLFTYYYQNGQKKSKANYKNGLIIDGLYNRWYENGQMEEEGTYKDGEKISSKEWNEDGSPK